MSRTTAPGRGACLAGTGRASYRPWRGRRDGLIASGEALEAGHFRGEGSVITQVSVNMGAHGTSQQAVAYFLFAAFQKFYYDGNKRTGRYMMNGHLMSNGIDAISVPAGRKQEFNTEMIDFYWQKDGTRMFRFLAGSGRKTLSRLGVAPVSREPGSAGQNLYDASKVRAAKARMPGRGKRSLDVITEET
jgi:hypothetical protein